LKSFLVRLLTYRLCLSVTVKTTLTSFTGTTMRGVSSDSGCVSALAELAGSAGPDASAGAVASAGPSTAGFAGVVSGVGGACGGAGLGLLTSEGAAGRSSAVWATNRTVPTHRAVNNSAQEPRKDRCIKVIIAALRRCNQASELRNLSNASGSGREKLRSSPVLGCVSCSSAEWRKFLSREIAGPSLPRISAGAP
jgi:hypothetical protein